MAANDNKHLRDIDALLEQVPEEGVFPRESWRTLYMFGVYLVNLLDAEGIVYRGHSLRESDEWALLVVRGILEKKAVVCFTNAIDGLNCRRVFLRKLESGTLEWRADKFA